MSHEYQPYDDLFYLDQIADITEPCPIPDTTEGPCPYHPEETWPCLLTHVAWLARRMLPEQESPQATKYPEYH